MRNIKERRLEISAEFKDLFEKVVEIDKEREESSRYWMGLKSMLISRIHYDGSTAKDMNLIGGKMVVEKVR